MPDVYHSLIEMYKNAIGAWRDNYGNEYILYNDQMLIVPYQISKSIDLIDGKPVGMTSDEMSAWIRIKNILNAIGISESKLSLNLTNDGLAGIDISIEPLNAISGTTAKEYGIVNQETYQKHLNEQGAFITLNFDPNDVLNNMDPYQFIDLFYDLIETKYTKSNQKIIFFNMEKDK